MNNIRLDISKAENFLPAGTLTAYVDKAKTALNAIETGKCPGNDFLGWITLPTDTTSQLLDDIKATAKVYREMCEYIVGRQLPRQPRCH